jgi:hypothetical protein
MFVNIKKITAEISILWDDICTTRQTMLTAVQEIVDLRNQMKNARAKRLASALGKITDARIIQDETLDKIETNVG